MGFLVLRHLQKVSDHLVSMPNWPTENYCPEKSSSHGAGLHRNKENIICVNPLRSFITPAKSGLCWNIHLFQWLLTEYHICLQSLQKVFLPSNLYLVLVFSFFISLCCLSFRNTLAAPPFLVIFHLWGQQTFSVKSQRVNILALVGHMISVAITHLCRCSRKASIDNMQMQEHVYGYLSYKFRQWIRFGSRVLVYQHLPYKERANKERDGHGIKRKHSQHWMGAEEVPKEERKQCVRKAAVPKAQRELVSIGTRGR